MLIATNQTCQFQYRCKFDNLSCSVTEIVYCFQIEMADLLQYSKIAVLGQIFMRTLCEIHKFCMIGQIPSRTELVAILCLLPDCSYHICSITLHSMLSYIQKYYDQDTNNSANLVPWNSHFHSVSSIPVRHDGAFVLWV